MARRLASWCARPPSWTTSCLTDSRCAALLPHVTLDGMRQLALALVLVASWSLQTARAEDDVDVPGLDAPDLRGDAMVWEDAVFFLEPWEGGTSVRLSTFSRGRAEEVGRTIPVRIVGSTMRSFVEDE